MYMHKDMDGWMDGGMDGWMDGRTEGGMDGWMDTYVCLCFSIPDCLSTICNVTGVYVYIYIRV